MNVSKEKGKNTWEVYFYTKDYTGKSHHRHKRGFKRKKDAEKYANNEIYKSKHDPRMTLDSLIQMYYEHISLRLRESTVENKKYIIDSKIKSTLGEKRVADITEGDIDDWQNKLAEKGFSDTYLRSINNQLWALFNYGEKMHYLPNPLKRLKKIGREDADEMDYLTLDEFERVIQGVSDNKTSTLQLNMLYWTGMRVGELLALNVSDVDINNRKITISKTFYDRSKTTMYGKPKTLRSHRTIDIPEFLANDIEEYLKNLYGPRGNNRLFECSAKHIRKELNRALENVGERHIRVHDLRHSHASLLIAMGEEPHLIAQRLGHVNTNRLYKTYAHVFPGKGQAMASRLNDLRGGVNYGTTQKSDNVVSSIC